MMANERKREIRDSARSISSFFCDAMTETYSFNYSIIIYILINIVNSLQNKHELTVRNIPQIKIDPEDLLELQISAAKWTKSILDDVWTPEVTEEERIYGYDLIRKQLKGEIKEIKKILLEKPSMDEMTEFIAKSKTIRFKDNKNYPTSEQIYNYSPTGELFKIFGWYAIAKRCSRKDLINR